jgi:TolB-like protein/DNA-binding winged helix-turn-helix (wHTH) protein
MISTDPSAGLRIGAWRVRPVLNMLERDGRSVRIEPRAMDVLVFLASHQGEVFSVDQLIASVWKGVIVSDSSVYLAISQLRQALGGSDDETSYIETIPKRGYRLAVPVGALDAKPQRLGWRIAAAAIAAVTIIGTIAAIALRDRTPDAPASVAVLPFENLSSDPEQAYFAEGITAELLTALSRVRDLRVATSMPGVEHVLRGSVRKAGEELRISAQLENARTGEQLWSETYERRLDDVFLIQDEIAASVADALQVRLGVGDVGRVPGMTRNVRAYDEYLRGMSLNRQWRAESFPHAIAHMQRAVAIDPGFSIAWAGLNTVYTNGALMVPVSAAEWRQKGADALAQARALTPDAPHVLLEAGIREVRQGNWLEAGEIYARLQSSYERYGMSEQAWGPRGAFLLAVGRAREAVTAFERARAQEPLAPAYAGFLAQAKLGVGDPAAALAEVDRGLALEGFDTLLHRNALFIALTQQDRSAIDARLRAIPEGDPGASVHRSLARYLDAPADAAVEIRRLASSGNGNESLLAHWAAYYGEPQLALELLARALPNIGHPSALWVPLMREVRRLPAFRNLVREYGYVDYWRRYGWSDFCHPTREQDFICE